MAALLVIGMIRSFFPFPFSFMVQPLQSTSSLLSATSSLTLSPEL